MLLEQVKNFYQTHSKEEIDKIWKDIIDEKHSGPTVTEYLNYLTIVELSEKNKIIFNTEDFQQIEQEIENKIMQEIKNENR